MDGLFGCEDPDCFSPRCPETCGDLVDCEHPLCAWDFAGGDDNSLDNGNGFLTDCDDA
ncbi:MAG: hypothetical protein ACJAZO_001523 [Myxococcota bacterium]|jgi:hypothetical protein